MLNASRLTFFFPPLVFVGEVFYFRLCNRQLRSYLDPKLSPQQRIEFAFYAMFCLEAWFSTLKEEANVAKRVRHETDAMAVARIMSEKNITATKAKEILRAEKKLKKEATKQAQAASKEEEKKRKKVEREEKKKAKKSKIAAPPTVPLAAPRPTATTATLSIPPPPPPPPPTTPRSTVAMQFVTRTAAAGVSFNAWFLLAFVDLLIRNNKLRSAIPFNPRFLTEQPAEKIFRATRATLGGENFTLAQFFQRCDHFMAHNILRAEHEGVDFVYPDHDAAFRWDEILKYDSCIGVLADTTSLDSITAAIKAAKDACVSHSQAVGIDVEKIKEILHLDVNANLKEMDEDSDETEVTPSGILVSAGEVNSMLDEMRQELLSLGEQHVVQVPLCYVFIMLTFLFLKQQLASVAPVMNLTDSAPVSTTPHQPCFAARQEHKKCEGNAHKKKIVLRAPNGAHYEVSKLHAFAIISGHPRCSKDRSLRVQTMSRFVVLHPNDTTAQGCFSAEPSL